MSTVFVDTSRWIAILSKNDRLHEKAVRRYEKLAEEGARLLTNNYVVDETATSTQRSASAECCSLQYRVDACVLCGSARKSKAEPGAPSSSTPT